MKIRERSVRMAACAIAGFVTASSAFAGSPFTENWTGSTSPYFNFLLNGGSTITSNVSDSAAGDGKIVQLALPAFPAASPNGGPNLQSTELFGFGTYEARIKTADCSSQPNSGIITGFFTYVNDGTDQDGNGTKDNSEIDFEWLCAEPNVVWLTQWTDFQESPLAMKRIFREVDLASGTIRQTCYSEGYGVCTQNLTGSASEGSPSTLAGLSGYNSSAAYYTYGFTWLTNRLTWYMYHPTTGAKIILWDYQGPTSRITQRQAYYMFNVWHTNNWSPPGLGATEQPNSQRFLKIDSARYAAGSGGTPTATPSPCASCTPTPTPTAAPTCYPPWVSNITYQAGARVTYNGNNYQANFGTNGDNPALHSGPAGSGQPWLTLGPCTGGQATPTATSRPTATSTPTTARATATPTSTARARATSTPTATTRPRATATATATTARPTPTTGGGSCAGVPAWVGGTSYSVGQMVTYVFRAGDNNPWPGTVGTRYLYRCATANNIPSWTPGAAGPSVWSPQGTCN